jgi:hypothetical protein
MPGVTPVTTVVWPNRHVLAQLTGLCSDAWYMAAAAGSIARFMWLLLLLASFFSRVYD